MAALPALPQDSSNPPYTVTDLGPYYRVWQRTVVLANATFDCFPISPTDFPPLFAAPYPHAFDGQFDPVFPQGYVCLDSYAVVVGTGTSCPGGQTDTGAGICHFLCDDYTWADADSSYFYYAWCDRSRTWTWTVNGVRYTRPDADVKFAKIRQ